MTQALPGEICAQRTVLLIMFIHLYQGAPEAKTAPQVSASITSTANLDFTTILSQKNTKI
jgi:hypothetical protein